MEKKTEFVYQNEAGLAIYRKARAQDGKWHYFWVVSCASSTATLPELKSKGRCYPYRLPDLLKSNRIVIVQTEEEVAALEEVGVVATCAPFGVEGWEPWWDEHFASKDIVLLLCGRNRLKDYLLRLMVEQILLPSCKTFKIASLPAKNGLVRWLKQHPRGELYPIIQKAKEIKRGARFNPLKDAGFLAESESILGLPITFQHHYTNDAPLFMKAIYGKLAELKKGKKGKGELLRYRLLQILFEVTARWYAERVRRTGQAEWESIVLRHWAYKRSEIDGDKRAAFLLWTLVLKALESQWELPAFESDEVAKLALFERCESVKGQIKRYEAAAGDEDSRSTFSHWHVPQLSPVLESTVTKILERHVGRFTRECREVGHKESMGSVLINIPFKADHANGIVDLALVVESIRKQTYCGGKLYIHVSEGSLEPEAEVWCKEHGVLYDHRPVLEFGANYLRNCGPDRIESTWILFLDQDVYLHQEYLRTMLSLFKDRNGKKKSCSSFFLLSTIRAECVGRVDLLEWAAGSREWETCTHSMAPSWWGAAVGNNLFMSRDVFRELGGWDEDLKYWGHEDLELSYRAHTKGLVFMRCGMPLCAHLRHLNRNYSPDLFVRNLKLILKKYPDMTATDRRRVDGFLEKAPVMNTPLIRRTENRPVRPRIRVTADDVSVTISAVGTVWSTEEGLSGQAGLSYRWTSDDVRCAELLNLDEDQAVLQLLPAPKTPGEYYIDLEVLLDGKPAGKATAYFEVDEGGDPQALEHYEVPAWSKRGVIYQIYPKSFSEQGGFKGVEDRLEYLKELGVDILMFTPLNEDGAAEADYSERSPADLFSVNPVYGTKDELVSLASKAHGMGMKLILDFPVNHLGSQHPIVKDVREKLKDSEYWKWLEHSLIPHNTNHLDQNVTSDKAMTYYGSWDLANVSWRCQALREHMVDAMRWWMDEFRFDGFRFDGYWGPFRRYGEEVFGLPLRRELRATHPGTLIIADVEGYALRHECDRLYPAYGGGVDYGLDWDGHWNGFRAAKMLPWSAHRKILLSQSGTRRLLRFLENHDEMRITYCFNSYEETLPLATLLLTTPGLPALYAGQEAGFGKGLSRRAGMRSKVVFDGPGKEVLFEHYRKLLHLRREHRELRSDTVECILVDSGRGFYLYAMLDGESRITVMVNLHDYDKKETLRAVEVFGEADKYGRLRDLYSGEVYEMEDGLVDIHLPAFRCVILKEETE